MALTPKKVVQASFKRFGSPVILWCVYSLFWRHDIVAAIVGITLFAIITGIAVLVLAGGYQIPQQSSAQPEEKKKAHAAGK